MQASLIIALGTLVFCSTFLSTVALNNGLVLTPPMGFCAWERFRCTIDCKSDPDYCLSEKLFVQIADRMAADGWLEAGYTQVNIDDCYLAMQRDTNGKLYADPDRFPNGLKWLGDYIHSKGLKFGVYEDFGTATCAGYPGTEYHIDIDAQTFAEWGTDMLKLDGCNSAVSDMEAGYTNMTRALNATGRPIVYSCSWPDYVRTSGIKPNYTEVAEYCNLWRLYDDIDDSWDSVHSIIDYWGDQQDILVPAAGPGHWNDMDMLIIGNFGLSYEQSKTQMGFWCLLASPLLMSADLRSISKEAFEIMQNKEVIAINQDPLGMQGRRLVKQSDHEIWARPLANDDVAFILFNPTNCCHVNITADLTQVGISSGRAVLRDVFAHEDLGEFSGTFSAWVNGNGVVMIRATPLA